MGNPGQRFQVNFFSEVQIYIIHYCVHALLVFLLGCLFCCMVLLGFSCCKIGGKEIGYLSDVAINAISLNKINYIPAQLFRASMKVLHSICNIFAFQMKNKCLQMTEEIKRQLWEWAAAYHCAGFIQNDPVQFPHRYERRQDIEISGLLTAIMSFGNRKQILKRLMSCIG